MIDDEVLAAGLADSPTRWRIECIDSIDSTNEELSRMYGDSAEVPHMLLWADEQKSGRGRLDRKWFSVPGADITATLLFPAPVPRIDVPKLSLTAGLALVNIVRDKYGIQALARWPNDVVTEKGKLAGILSMYLATPNAVVCGIGINVNSHSGAFSLGPYRSSTTLLTELGREISRENLLATWVLEFESLWDLAHSDRIDELRRVFDSVSFYRGRRVKVLLGAQMMRDEDPECEELEGIAGGLDRMGALLVNLPDGKSYAVNVEDVLIPFD